MIKINDIVYLLIDNKLQKALVIGISSGLNDKGKKVTHYELKGFEKKFTEKEMLLTKAEAISALENTNL